MFKSVLSLGWFSRNHTQGPLSSSEINTSFTMPDPRSAQVYHVSMSEDAEEFVDIAYRKLSYAEAASIARHRQQTSKVPHSRRNSARVTHNQYAVLAAAEDDDEMGESVVVEKYKYNNYFRKKKVYKEADKQKAVRSKQRRASKV